MSDVIFGGLARALLSGRSKAAKPAPTTADAYVSDITKSLESGARSVRAAITISGPEAVTDTRYHGSSFEENKWASVTRYTITAETRFQNTPREVELLIKDSPTRHEVNYHTLISGKDADVVLEGKGPIAAIKDHSFLPTDHRNAAWRAAALLIGMQEAQRPILNRQDFTATYKL